MIKGIQKILILSTLILFLLPASIFAGTTGKIAGRVIDRQTSEPLPGVNVVIQGTTMGASTDPDGYYVILAIPPGQYTIVASMVGYAPITVNDVEVHIDQTSPVNINMLSNVIELNSITVMAERNLIKKDVSTSVASIETEEIKVLPVSSVDQIASLQAGVEKGLVVRGGQADQLLLQVDGVTLRDPRNNKPISSVALTSIQEVSIERGGFNAEYGQVRSGIINIVGKEGDANSYYGSIQMKYSPPTQKNFGMSVFDPMSMWNRPYLDPAVAMTGTENGAWDVYTRRQYPRFEGWNAISQSLLLDGDPTNDLTPAAAQKVWTWERRRNPVIEPDYNVDASFGGPVPFVSKQLGNLRFFTSYRLEREMLLIPQSRPDYKEYSFNAKVNSDFSQDAKLMLNSSFGRSYNVALNANDNQFNNPNWGINGIAQWNPTDYMRTPFQIAEITNEQRPSRIWTDSWYGQAQVDFFTLSGKFTNFLSPSTFYEIGFENVNRNYLTGHTRDRDTSKIYEVVPGHFYDEAPNGWSPFPTSGLTGMFFGGHSGTMRDSSKLGSYLLKADLTSQITKEHLIKTGVEFSYYNLNLNYGAVNEFFRDVNYVKQKYSPYRLSAYAQDKIEAFGFIANLGLRLDYSNPNTDWVQVDPFYAPFYSTSYNANGQYTTVKANSDLSLSPRLGISHPITDESKLYFNYGHFKQFPAYEETFRMGRSQGGSLRNIGNPGLVQARTISYELGYDHVLFNDYSIQIAAFYNDISNQQGFTAYLSDRKGIGYFIANNDLYADTRGLEITIKKTYGSWIRGFATYTYQVTTNGAFGTATINEDPAQQLIYERNTANLYQQRPVPQPRANISLTFLTPKEWGPTFAGVNPLGDWTLNVVGTWKAGEWLNYNPNLVTEIGAIIQNVQVKDFTNIDLRLIKNFDVDVFSIGVFMEVTNLLNGKFLSGASFYDVHDQQFYFQSLHLPESRAYNNIPGDDRVGEYRRNGSAYQPIETITNTGSLMAADANASVIYYDQSTRKYMNAVNGQWSEVESSRMQKVLDDKAYIDMPNNSSFDFLNPRQVFFGINFSFKF